MYYVSVEDDCEAAENELVQLERLLSSLEPSLYSPKGNLKCINPNPVLPLLVKYGKSANLSKSGKFEVLLKVRDFVSFWIL